MEGRKRYQAFPRRRGNNITLIGMPGSGKSTLARISASMMKRPYIDTDHVLCAMENVRSTGELSAKTDFHGFVEAEERAIRSLPLDLDNHFIATGGSAVYSARGMRHLQKLGPILYIEVPVGILQSRLGDLDERGVILRKGQTFEDLYKDRHRLYRRYADMEFRVDELDVGSSAKLLVALVTFLEKEREKHHA